MIQEVIALSIVFFAVVFTIYQAIVFFIPSKSTDKCAKGCSSCGIHNYNALKNLHLDQQVIVKD